MDWIQVFTIIGVLGAFTFWLFSKLDSDIKTIGNRLDNHMTSINARTDQLYHMFYDLLKETKEQKNKQ